MTVAADAKPTSYWKLSEETLSHEKDASTAFPESWFQPPPHRLPQYERLVASGYRRMKSRRVVIAGLARNIEDLAHQTCARIEELGRLFADYRVVLFENDSSDATLEALKRWSAANRRFTVLTEQLSHPVHWHARCPKRTEKMAYYRNRYHDYIATVMRETDDVIVVDTDLAGGWSYDGVANTYGHSGWDMVGSYGIIYKRHLWRINHYLHYDAWAFRFCSDFRPLTTRAANALSWQRGDPLVPVSSCFGGLAVYRGEAFMAGTYHGGDCEHIAFHRTMQGHGFRNFFLNPSQINIYGRRRRTLDPLYYLGTCLWKACGMSGPTWRFQENHTRL